jgi:hypothetical protein
MHQTTSSVRAPQRVVKRMPIKDAVPGKSDDLRPEYDLSRLKGGVRGKYYERATAGTTLVLLDRDVADAFPDGRTINEALRALIRVAETQVRTAGSDATPASRRLQPTKPRRKPAVKQAAGKRLRG